jgi:hypothetical protein
MPTYYRGPEVLITHEVFVIWAPQPHAFRINELRNVHLVRGDLHPVRMITAHVAGAAIMVATASWPFLTSPGQYVAALMFVATPSLASGTAWRLRPRALELRATYRQLEVLLYSSTDATRFGQVTRGLIRALEGRRYRLEQMLASRDSVTGEM